MVYNISSSIGLPGTRILGLCFLLPKLHPQKIFSNWRQLMHVRSENLHANPRGTILCTHEFVIKFWRYPWNSPNKNDLDDAHIITSTFLGYGIKLRRVLILWLKWWSTSCYGFSQLHVSTLRSSPCARWVLCFKLHFWNFDELEALNFPPSYVFATPPGPSSSCGRHGVMDHQQTNTGMWMRWSPVYVEESPEMISTWSINSCSVMITTNLL